MIAFHFPPQSGSSGAQRTLGFTRYLRDFGWEPAVLTVDPRAYESVDERAIAPDGIRVHRTFAFDAARHFAIRDRYPSFLARPDRWTSWRWSAIIAGVTLVRRWQPHVLWSTYPIATAHVIGHSIARITGMPWVADFRDPMAQEGYPADPRTWKSFKRIESTSVAIAARSVFTAPGAANLYCERYPAHADRIMVIENGFDEESFAGLADASPYTAAPAILLHSGIVYPSERDPTQMFAALRALVDAGDLREGDLRLRFRAPVHGAMIESIARTFDVSQFVEVAPPLPYREALREMLSVNALLVLQASNCNQQIPAKLYEYLRTGRPIVGLADPQGDTGQALRRAGVNYIAALETREAIVATLRDFLRDLRTGIARGPASDAIHGASRRERTQALATVFEEVARR